MTALCWILTLRRLIRVRRKDSDCGKRRLRLKQADRPSLRGVFLFFLSPSVPALLPLSRNISQLYPRHATLRSALPLQPKTEAWSLGSQLTALIGAFGRSTDWEVFVLPSPVCIHSLPFSISTPSSQFSPSRPTPLPPPIIKPFEHTGAARCPLPETQSLPLSQKSDFFFLLFFHEYGVLNSIYRACSFHDAIPKCMGF